MKIDSPHLQTSANEDLNLLIDSVELLREVYKKSLTISELINKENIEKTEKKHQNFNNIEDASQKSLLIELNWLIGDSVSVFPPLLHCIRVVKDDFALRGFTVQFIDFNISIHSSAPTQWVDHRSNRTRFTFGDLLLFALQLQTGQTKSQHIVELGHFPFSILVRKPLISMFQQKENDETQNPLFYAPNNYDAHVLTPVQRVDKNQPITISSINRLFPLFKISNEEEATERNIVVGCISSFLPETPSSSALLSGPPFKKRKHDGWTQKLDSRYEIPIRSAFMPSILFKRK